jgi:hypothetical protein
VPKKIEKKAMQYTLKVLPNVSYNLFIESLEIIEFY